MYAFDFKPKNNGIDHGLIFVAMPFGDKYDPIYNDLIEPSIKLANVTLDKENHLALEPFRTQDDIRTTSGWINILEHLYRAQIVIGVLTRNNQNVFYELGIAHATQQIARQILIANKGYKRSFDTKDLIYHEYNTNNIPDSVDILADKIINAIKTYKLDHEQRVVKARSMMGPFEFDVMMHHGKHSHFYIHAENGKEEYEKNYGSGSYERRIQGIEYLCHQGLLYFNTDPTRNEKGELNIGFAYWWTGIGNDVLNLLKIITDEDLLQRRKNIPVFSDL
jgi:hypothetical protein